MRQALLALVAIGLVASLAGAGTVAFFSDTETSSGNTFTAGTLDLKVDGGDVVAPARIDNIKPGDTITKVWTLQNVGSLDGILYVTFSKITNNDNGCNDPEEEAEILEYGGASGGDGEGELGAYLRTWVFRSHLNVELTDWFIGDYHAHDLTGYLDPHTKALSFGLNYLGGKTMKSIPLPSGSFVMIRLTLSLDADLKNDASGWGGGSTFDIDDDVTQSDSVEFDIIFRLDQV